MLYEVITDFDTGNIYHTQIHTNITNKWSQLTIYPYTTTPVTHFTVQSVGIPPQAKWQLPNRASTNLFGHNRLFLLRAHYEFELSWFSSTQ